MDIKWALFMWEGTHEWGNCHQINNALNPVIVESDYRLSFLSYVAREKDYDEIKNQLNTILSSLISVHGYSFENDCIFFSKWRYMNIHISEYNQRTKAVELIINLELGGNEWEIDHWNTSTSENDVNKEEAIFFKDLFREIPRCVWLQCNFIGWSIKWLWREATDTIQGINCSQDVCTLIKETVKEKNIVMTHVESYNRILDIFWQNNDIPTIHTLIEQSSFNVFLFENNIELYDMIMNLRWDNREDVIVRIIEIILLDQKSSTVSLLRRWHGEVEWFLSHFDKSDRVKTYKWGLYAWSISKETFVSQLGQIEKDIERIENDFDIALDNLTDQDELRKMIQDHRLNQWGGGQFLKDILNTRESGISWLSAALGNAYSIGKRLGKVTWGLMRGTQNAVKSVSQNTYHTLNNKAYWTLADNEEKNYQTQFDMITKMIYLYIDNRDLIIKEEVDALKQIITQLANNNPLFNGLKLIYLWGDYINAEWEKVYVQVKYDEYSNVYNKLWRYDKQVFNRKSYIKQYTKSSLYKNLAHYTNDSDLVEKYKWKQIYLDNRNRDDILYVKWDNDEKVLFNDTFVYEIHKVKILSETNKSLSYIGFLKPEGLKLWKVENIFWESQLYIWEIWSEVYTIWGEGSMYYYHKTSLHNGTHHYSDVFMNEDWKVLKNKKWIPYSTWLWKQWKIYRVGGIDCISLNAWWKWEILDIQTWKPAKLKKKWNLLIPSGRENAYGNPDIINTQKKVCYCFLNEYHWEWQWINGYIKSDNFHVELKDYFTWVWFNKDDLEKIWKKVKLADHSESEIQTILLYSTWLSFRWDRCDYETWDEEWRFIIMKWTTPLYQWEWFTYGYSIEKYIEWWRMDSKHVNPVSNISIIYKPHKKVSYSPAQTLPDEVKDYDNCWELTFIVDWHEVVQHIFPDDEITIF